MAVLMLKTFAVKRRAAECTAKEKTLRAGVGSRPDQIADPLEAEHRVVDEHGDHVHTMRRIRRASRDERRHRTSFRDPFFEQLAVLRFLVERELVGIDRLVELTEV